MDQLPGAGIDSVCFVFEEEFVATRTVRQMPRPLNLPAI